MRTHESVADNLYAARLGLCFIQQLSKISCKRVNTSTFITLYSLFQLDFLEC